MDFNFIPDQLRIPGAYIEVDGSMAGLNSGGTPNLLLVGQKLPTGTAVAGEITFISHLEDAIAKAGAGSMLAQMAARFYAINPLLNLYMLPFAESVSGAKAQATLTVTSAPTEAGVLSLYIGGNLISVAVTSADTTATVAAAIKAAIDAVEANNANTLSCVASVAGNVVTLTSKGAGSYGNGIDVRFNAGRTDKTPAGLIVSNSGFAGGTMTPAAITDANIAAIFDADASGFLDSPAKYMALGLNDDVTVQAFHVESQRRYAPPIQSGFRAFTALNADYATTFSYGAAKNCEHICCVALNNAQTSAWEAAAIIATAAAPALYDNPVKSLEGINLLGLKLGNYFSFSQMNALLYKGISIVQRARDGSVSIKRLISLYQYRPDNSADDAYLDINTTEVLERIRYEQRMAAIQRFAGTVAAKSNQNYRPGLNITTVAEIRGFLLSMYRDTLQAELGWVQEYEYYKQHLVVEQDPRNPSRFNYTDTPVILSPFYILAGKAQFRKYVG